MSVIDGAFETKGTNLYFADPITSSDPAVRKVTCPTAITGINAGTKDRIDTTCLNHIGASRTYMGGFSDAGEVNVPIILKKGDASHTALLELKRTGEIIGWMVGLSDSQTDPTLDSDDDLVPPGDRSTMAFDGYVSGLSFDAALNDTIRGTLTIQASGDVELTWGA